MMLKNKLGMTKYVESGFCWLTFFFGIFVPLFRGMAKEVFVWLGVLVLTSLLIPFPLSFIVGGIYAFYMCTVMNEKYIEHLVSKGYEPVKEEKNDEN